MPEASIKIASLSTNSLILLLEYLIMSGATPELGDKSWLGAVITGTAVGAFVASNLYVFGISLALQQNLAQYFEIVDYVQVTPAWGLPALLSLVLGMAFLFLAYLSAIYRGSLSFAWFAITKSASAINILEFERDDYKRRERWEKLKGEISDYFNPVPVFRSWWRVPYSLVAISLALYAVAVISEHESWWLTPGQARFLASISLLWTIVFVAERLTDIICKFVRKKWTPPKTVAPKVIEICWSTTPFAMGAFCFAFFYGFLVAPILINYGAHSTISISQEGPSVEGSIDLPGKKTKLDINQKESILTGRIVFRLSHSLILLPDVDGNILVYPEEKIEMVKTPRSFLERP